MMKMLCAVLLLGFAPHCFASDDGLGTVNITGFIHDNTCTVSTTDLQITMGNISDKQLEPAGKSGNQVKFTIGLKDCGSAASNVAVTFIGTAPAPGSPLIAVDDNPGAAKGVGIALLDDQQHTIPVNSSSRNYPLTASSPTASLDFFAQYTSFTDTVTSGPASASVTFNLTYQ